MWSTESIPASSNGLLLAALAAAPAQAINTSVWPLMLSYCLQLSLSLQGSQREQSDQGTSRFSACNGSRFQVTSTLTMDHEALFCQVICNTFYLVYWLVLFPENRALLIFVLPAPRTTVSGLLAIQSYVL